MIQPGCRPVCVVTGATAGIGRATALELARRGCTVWAVCRDLDRGRALAGEAEGDVRPIRADLGRLDDVRELGTGLLDRAQEIHVLVNNAAVVHDRYGETVDGIERQLAINHVAPFLLTRMLLPRLLASAPARIVTVSSRSHAYGRIHFDDLGLRRGYGALRAYRQSKLANVLFTIELARRLEGSGVIALSLDPGRVATGIGRTHTRGWIRWAWALLRPFQRDPALAAAEVAELGLSPRWAGANGQYFREGRLSEAHPSKCDHDVAHRLWKATERLIGPL